MRQTGKHLVVSTGDSHRRRRRGPARKAGQLAGDAGAPRSSSCAVGFAGGAITTVAAGPADIVRTAISAGSTIATAAIAGRSARTAGTTGPARTTDPWLANNARTLTAGPARTAGRPDAASTTGPARTANPDDTR